MKISFFGHKRTYDCNAYYDKIIEVLTNAIKTQESLEIYCGGINDFDFYCSRLARNLKVTYPQIKLYYVTPYLRESYLKNIDITLYDDIIYPPIENTPLKFAILKRNQWIVENSDLIIFYLMKTFGGTYTTYKYAKKKNKNILIINN